MLSSLLIATAFQIGPFYEQRPDYFALRPIVSHEAETTDVLWPVFTSHRDWWRFCFIVNYQNYGVDEGYQFSVLPIWFNGEDKQKGAYAGLFPITGYHPHILMLHDWEFAMWPVWMRYKMPRGRDWLETNSVLFPFISWRSDGAWSVWPFYGVNYQRESDHRYAFWPVVTWAKYRADRDTAGAGYSWMVWPLYGKVRRERERQTMYLPPFFSLTEIYTDGKGRRGEMRSFPFVRLRCPWPFLELEDMPQRTRISFWPFYESVENYSYKDGSRVSGVKRFGWKLVEIYDDETRIFPFWTSSEDFTRVWPFWECEEDGEITRSKVLSLMPIRWDPAVERNWSKFWTLYENESCPVYTDHSLLWGLIRWRTNK